MKKISVIVPVYKVEQYLSKCIESLLSQTYNNLEIILVDDGSPDRCGEICDFYSQKDSRVTVIHKRNGGLSDARNVGLKNCHGEYITLIDSDDYVLPDYCQVLLDLLIDNNADVSCVPICKYSESGKDISRKYSGKLYEYTAAEAMTAMFENNKLSWCAQAKLYKRNLFNGIEYPVGKIMEDKATTYKIYNKCSKIVFKDTVEYMYLVRSGSIMNSGWSDKRLESFDIQIELNKFIEENYPNSILITHAYTAKVAVMFLCHLTSAGSNDISKYQLFQNYVKKYKGELYRCRIIDNRYKLVCFTLNMLHTLQGNRTYSSAIYKKICHLVVEKKQA